MYKKKKIKGIQLRLKNWRNGHQKDRHKSVHAEGIPVVYHPDR